MITLPSSAGDTLLELTSINKTFTVRNGFKKEHNIALNNVDLVLQRSHVLGVIGESGSGKSTLANVLMGLERPDSGTMLFDGKQVDLRSLKSRAKIARDIQIVFQDPYSSLNPRMDVFNLLKEPLRHEFFTSTEARRRRCVELLEMVGLDENSLDKHPHQFSGGQRQRIAIARALALNPKVLVCDEAVSALDVSIQVQVLNLLAELQTRLGLSIVFIAHGLAAVQRICDDVMVMRAGKVVEMGTAEEVLNNPTEAYTQRLVEISRDIVPFKLMSNLQRSSNNA